MDGTLLGGRAAATLNGSLLQRMQYLSDATYAVLSKLSLAKNRLANSIRSRNNLFLYHSEQGNIPEMEASLPYVPCLITLPDAGNIRLISNIVDVPVTRITIGASVTVVWALMPDGSVVPRFTLRD